MVNGNNTPAISLDDTRAVVARVLERFEPAQLTLEDVREQVVADLTSQRATQLAQEAHAAALARVEAGESVSDVAESYGLEWQTYTLATRNQAGVPAPISRKAFELPRPLENDKSVGSVDLAGGQAVITVTRVQDGDLSIMTDSEVNDLREVFQGRNERLDFATLFQAFRADADIETL